MVDMEGISGICQRSQVSGTEYYNVARKYMTWDVNACVDGCYQGGAKEVIVLDAHYMSFNLLWDELDPRARYIQGRSPDQRMPDIKNYDGLILLGYHAMAGTRFGVLEHTMSSSAWQNFWINGKKSGEIAIDAAIAGTYNVPVIMVSGDDKACNEAKSFLGNVVTAEVKKGLEVEGAILLSKPKAHSLITEKSAEAVKNCKKAKIYKVKSPVTLRLELVSRGFLPRRSGVTIVDGRTYEVSAKTIEDALKLL